MVRRSTDGPLDGVSDVELLRLHCSGDERAFAVLFHRHADAVHRLGVAMLRDGAADDLVQDTFLRLWRVGRQYSPAKGSPRTWLLAIARNRALDLIRASGASDRMIDAVGDLAAVAPAPPDLATEYASREDAARLRARLSEIPSAQRRALALVYLGGLSHGDVARRIGIPLGTVKSRVRLGKHAVAAGLDA